MDRLEKLLVEIIKGLGKEERLTDKRIKQLYDMIGDSDKIFEGDSSVEVVDLGTGYIQTLADNQQVRKDQVLGNIQPLQPAFLAYNSENDVDVTGDGTAFTLEFDSEIYDQGGDFATPNLTSPVDGRYSFKCLVLAENVVGTDARLQLITSNRTYWSNILNPTAVKTAGGDVGFVFSMEADMDANDTAYMQIVITGGAKTVRIGGHATIMQTCFSGVLLC